MKVSFRVCKVLALCAMSVLAANAFAGGNSQAPAQAASTESIYSTTAPAEPLGVDMSVFNGKIFGLQELPFQVTLDVVNKSFGFTPSAVATFPTINEAVAALIAGRVDMVNTTTLMGAFTASSNQLVELYDLKDPYVAPVKMLLLSSNTELLGTLNKAIASLKADGTLDSLKATWLKGGPSDIPSGAPTSVPAIAGAKTITVGLSGDMAPLDYVLPNGLPTGYNVAVMSAVSKAANVNVELVVMPYNQKFTALKSGRIDLYFIQNDSGLPEGYAMTDPYLDNPGTTAFLVRKGEF
jgi:ABC-type amino acid transport substrate-binding protein